MGRYSDIVGVWTEPVTAQLRIILGLLFAIFGLDANRTIIRSGGQDATGSEWTFVCPFLTPLLSKYRWVREQTVRQFWRCRTLRQSSPRHIDMGHPNLGAMGRRCFRFIECGGDAGEQCAPVVSP